MTIKGILFDKDGTLIDFDRTWFAIGERLAFDAAAGDRVEAERLLDRAGYDFRLRRFRPDSVFAAGTNADIVALWYPDLAPKLRAEIIVRFNRFTAHEGALRAVPVSGALDAVTKLHGGGYRLGVATNDSTGGAAQTLLMLGVSQMFSATYGYDAVVRPKPAPDTVFAFCELTGLKPDEIAMVGDNRHDLEMARAAGAGMAIGVLSGTGTRDSLTPMADAVLGSVADLPGFLEAA